MPEVKVSKIWFYILFIPSILAVMGSGIVFIANSFEWGSESGIPAAMLIGLFFAEVTMVISALGIIAYIKIRPQAPVLKAIGVWNIVVLIVAGIIGFNIFMQL